MNITQRSFSSENDKQLMSALVHRFPAAHLHVTDLPYRLSSWAFDDSGNVNLWINDAQQLVAWAVLQAPFWTLDYAFDPSADPHLHRRILAWADARAREVRDTPSGHPTWYVNVFTEQAGRIRDLEEAGFASQTAVAEDA